MKKPFLQRTCILSTKQRRILQELEDNIEVIKEYSGDAYEKIESFKEDPAVKEIFYDYQNIIFKAIRANLHEHPLVPNEIKKLLLEWLHNYESLGNRELLRRVMRGLETGVTRQLSKEEAELKIAIEELRLGVAAEPDYRIDENDAMTLGEILQEIRSTRTLDLKNPPQTIRPWTRVHRILVKRGMVNSSRQAFLRRAKRLCPSLFPKKKVR